MCLKKLNLLKFFGFLIISSNVTENYKEGQYLYPSNFLLNPPSSNTSLAYLKNKVQSKSTPNKKKRENYTINGD